MSTAVLAPENVIPLKDYVSPGPAFEVRLLMSTFPTHVTVGHPDSGLDLATADPARLILAVDPHDVTGRGVLCLVMWDPPGIKSSQPPVIAVSARVKSGFTGRRPTGLLTLEDGRTVRWMPARGCGCGARLKSGRLPWATVGDEMGTSLRVVTTSDRPWRHI